MVSFYVIDAVQTPTLYINPDSILLNGDSATYTYDSTTHLVTMEVPSGEFTIQVAESGYTTSAELTYTYLTLKNETIQLSPIVEGQKTALLSWYQPTGNTVDLDSHMVIRSGGSKIGESSYHNYTYSDANTTVTLNHDDTTGQYGGNETITIDPIYNGYEYVYVVIDYSHRTNPSAAEITTRNTACQYSNGVNTEVINVANATIEAQGQYWEVFKIVNGEFITINKITDVNNYNITP